jgi:hypothetical protein
MQVKHLAQSALRSSGFCFAVKWHRNAVWALQRCRDLPRAIADESRDVMRPCRESGIRFDWSFPLSWTSSCGVYSSISQPAILSHADHQPVSEYKPSHLHVAASVATSFSLLNHRQPRYGGVPSGQPTKPKEYNSFSAAGLGRLEPGREKLFSSFCSDDPD